MSAIQGRQVRPISGRLAEVAFMDRGLDDAVRAAVGEAISSGRMLCIPRASRRIAAAFPKSGVPASEIAELLLRAGVSARVPLEWDRLKD